MIRAFGFEGNRLCETDLATGMPSAPCWIDLLNPTSEEEILAESATGADIPTIEEMAEIEISSRLYREEGVAYATILALSHTEQEEFQLKPLTFVLASNHLVTVRYHEPRAISLFEQRLRKEGLGGTSAPHVLLGLIEAIVDRIADILERVAREIDVLSARIFGLRGAQKAKGGDFSDVLMELGRKGDLASAIRDSLATLDRAASWLMLVLPGYGKDKGLKEQLKSVARDVHALADHTGFVSQKIVFLLDATLGLINIEQNNIIKIFSIAAVGFLPPTLVASIYGMNFEHMPELSWTWGYPMAIGLMVLSAVLPILYFKRKGWL